MQSVIIHTDGACLGNPGPGGWGSILQLKDTPIRKELAGGFRLTTNNRMELMAALKALQALKRPCKVDLYTDSRYLRDSVENGWVHAWRGNNFRKRNNKLVPNTDLWKRLLELLQIHSIQFFWIQGHAGHPENERCDQMARQFAQMPDLPPDEPYELMKAQSSDRCALG